MRAFPFRPIHFFFLAFFFLSAGALAGTGVNGPGWEGISDKDHIQVYKRVVPDSPIVAIKAESVLNASLERVATVINQVEKQPQWVPYLLEARQWRVLSFYDRLIYTVSDAPWPVKDRDFLIRSRLRLDRGQKKIIVEMQSVQDPKMPPRKGRIRGQMAFSRLILQSRAHDTKTFFCMELLVDPKGWIPKWIVNLIQRKWARRYVMGLRNRVAMPDIRANPAIKKFIGEASRQEKNH